MNGERKYDGRHTAGDIPSPPQNVKVVGDCPSCGAELSIGDVVDPRTGKTERGLLHKMPFCNYFGATSPEQIEVDVKANKEIS